MVTDTLWSIKRYDSQIDFKDLLDFYKEYQFNRNLVIDAVNAQVIQYDGLNMPFSHTISHNKTDASHCKRML